MFGFDCLMYDCYSGQYYYAITDKLGLHGYLTDRGKLGKKRTYPFSHEGLKHNWSDNRYDLTHTVVYVGEDGAVWASEVEFSMKGELTSYNASSRATSAGNLMLKTNISISPFKTTEKFIFNAVPLQRRDTLEVILRNVNPYALQTCIQHGGNPLNFLMSPQLETLLKAGYIFADKFVGDGCSVGVSSEPVRSDVDCFNRLCKRGNSPATILKTTKAVYKVLREHERDMSVWDTYRKLDKFGRISQDTIRETYDHGMSVKNLDLINQILSQTYLNKAVFDWNTLVYYLNRLDRYEAIGNDEALQLLKDYLNMCRQLGMRPRTDGDSLKREHDVAARLCRSQYNEKLAMSMIPACEKLAKYNYYEGVYFIRGIKDFDDLLSEATQQHSCLVSYGKDIADGKSRVFVLREVSRPDRSLITVELSHDGKSIRQALTAYNKPIRNRSQHEFLDRWLAYVKDVDRYKIA